MRHAVLLEAAILGSWQKLIRLRTIFTRLLMTLGVKDNILPSIEYHTFHLTFKLKTKECLINIDFTVCWIMPFTERLCIVGVCNVSSVHPVYVQIVRSLLLRLRLRQSDRPSLSERSRGDTRSQSSSFLGQESNLTERENINSFSVLVIFVNGPVPVLCDDPSSINCHTFSNL